MAAVAENLHLWAAAADSLLPPGGRLEPRLLLLELPQPASNTAAQQGTSHSNSQPRFNEDFRFSIALTRKYSTASLL